MDRVKKTRYKRRATDFSSLVGKTKAGGCDLVVFGTLIRKTIGAVAETRNARLNPIFLGSSASYPRLIDPLESIFRGHPAPTRSLDCSGRRGEAFFWTG